jgi:GNAT superfamily N-acetyltransferase
MSDGLVVRPAVIDDLSDIVDLRLALLREYGNDPVYTRLRDDARERAHELYFAQLTSPHETILLAQRHRRVVGILRCVESPGSPLLHPDRYCYVSSVYVVPPERRRGVLRALLAAADEWCRRRGIDEMRLHNATSSPVAGEIWNALGFDVVEQVRRRSLGTNRSRQPTSTAHAEVR